jgi:hypothetical protein
MITGTQPIDGGNLILDAAEYAEFIAREPESGKFIRPFPRTDEFVNGVSRWILEHFHRRAFTLPKKCSTLSRSLAKPPCGRGGPRPRRARGAPNAIPPAVLHPSEVVAEIVALMRQYRCTVENPD